MANGRGVPDLSVTKYGALGIPQSAARQKILSGAQHGSLHATCLPAQEIPRSTLDCVVGPVWAQVI